MTRSFRASLRTRAVSYAFRSLVAAVLLAIAGCSGPTLPHTTVQGATPTPTKQDGASQAFVTAQGTQFFVSGHPIKLYGCTFYPSLVGGTRAWHQASFTTYIDQTLDMAGNAGQNLIRPTDFWDKTTANQTYDDPQVWANMDYLVRAAKRRGMYIVMDLSAYRWLLTSQNKDAYDAASWDAYLAFVAKRYQSETAIAFYSIVGEPTPPKTPAATAQLVTFYRAVTDKLYSVDQGRHLITAGGFNRMGEEYPSTPWWHEIYALPHNDVIAFKTYTQEDIGLMAKVAAYAQQLQKPLTDEEFGLPQNMGDSSYAGGGVSYYGITTSRSTFYDTIYTNGERLGVTSFVFWNLGCELKPTSYEVSPNTPAVWNVVRAHAPASPATEPATPLCA